MEDEAIIVTVIFAFVKTSQTHFITNAFISLQRCALMVALSERDWGIACEVTVNWLSQLVQQATYLFQESAWYRVRTRCFTRVVLVKKIVFPPQPILHFGEHILYR